MKKGEPWGAAVILESSCRNVVILVSRDCFGLRPRNDGGCALARTKKRSPNTLEPLPHFVQVPDVEEKGYLYILTNKYNRVLYTGVTSHLTQRISEHKSHLVAGFTKRYNCDKLVYYEDCGGIVQAIIREKQLKGGSRIKKLALIKKFNPQWRDLSFEIYGL